MVEANRRDGCRGVLPAEDSEHGRLAPATPANVIEFSLDADQFQDFVETVYNSGEPMHSDSCLRRSWDALRSMGIDTTRKRPAGKSRPSGTQDSSAAGRSVKMVSDAPEPIKPTSGTTGGSHKDPENMSQSEYEVWRGKSA